MNRTLLERLLGLTATMLSIAVSYLLLKEKVQESKKKAFLKGNLRVIHGEKPLTSDSK
jgi:hypothetical protein